MKSVNEKGIKIREGTFSNYLVRYSFGAIWLGGMSALLFLPLASGFRIMHLFIGALQISLFIGLLFVIDICMGLCSIILDEDQIKIKWFGIITKTISVSDLKMFCTVGNQYGSMLCLSGCSVSELADKQERWMAGSFFHNSEVPYRKQNPNWQDIFARDYLLRLQKKTFQRFREPNVWMLEMNPTLQCLIRQRYPELLYKNYALEYEKNTRDFIKKNEKYAFCLEVQRHKYKVHMEEKGIHLTIPEKEIMFIPADQIRTIVRVEVFHEQLFREKEKCSFPYYIPLLFLTGLSETQLAEQAPNKEIGDLCQEETIKQELLAMTAASHIVQKWNKSMKDCCVLYYTEKTLERVQTLYPHAQLNELAAGWSAEAEGTVK